MTPEGTRYKSGQLKRAHPGAILLALRSRAPLLPEYYGGAYTDLEYATEKYLANLPR